MRVGLSKSLVTAAMLFVAGVATANAGALLSEKAAVSKAVDYLFGAPYGETRAEVLGHIQSKELIRDGRSKCADAGRPAWQFHVVVPQASKTSPAQDGYLVLDAKTGADICHNLGLLD